MDKQQRCEDEETQRMAAEALLKEMEMHNQQLETRVSQLVRFSRVSLTNFVCSKDILCTCVCVCTRERGDDSSRSWQERDLLEAEHEHIESLAQREQEKEQERGRMGEEDRRRKRAGGQQYRCSSTLL